MNALHDLAVRWASRESRVRMTDLEIVIIQYYHQSRTDDDKLKAEGAAMKLKKLQAAVEAAWQALMVSMWELDYQDDGIIARCVGCYVERDDLESGVDKHADGCIIAHAFATLAAERGGEG